MTEFAVVEPSNLNPEDRKKVKNAIKEIAEAMTHIADYQIGIKDVLARLEGEVGIKKKTLRKLARTYYKDEFARVKEETEYFETVFDQLFNTPELP